MPRPSGGIATITSVFRSALAIGALAFLTAGSAACASTLEGKVVSVADGDTLTVLDLQKTTHKIRLAGIDAPEKKQPYGHISKERLLKRTIGKQVTVEFSKNDKFGRIVGKITINGADICLEQVKAGLAWHYKAFEKEQSERDRQDYSAAESHARNQKLGLWRDIDPIPPWEWRKARRR